MLSPVCGHSRPHIDVAARRAGNSIYTCFSLGRDIVAYVEAYCMGGGQQRLHVHVFAHEDVLARVQMLARAACATTSARAHHCSRAHAVARVHTLPEGGPHSTVCIGPHAGVERGRQQVHLDIDVRARQTTSAVVRKHCSLPPLCPHPIFARYKRPALQQNSLLCIHPKLFGVDLSSSRLQLLARTSRMGFQPSYVIVSLFL